MSTGGSVREDEPMVVDAVYYREYETVSGALWGVFVALIHLFWRLTIRMFSIVLVVMVWLAAAAAGFMIMALFGGG